MSSFVYDGGALAVPGERAQSLPITAGWNPQASAAHPSALAPGVHVSFFGEGAGCPAGTSNGPVVTLSPPLAAQAGTLTGIEADPDHADLSWTPAADPARCRSGGGLNPGPAFVVANPQPAGGVGLFTDAGAGRRIAGPNFWHAFSQRGQNGAGANAFIEATFVTWIFNWRKHQAVAPWSGGGGDPQATLASTQSMPTAAATQSRPGAEAVQVKQQYAVTFINPPCLKVAARKSLCQVRYLFQTALVRAGVVTAQERQWLDHAHLLLDPAQNSLPVFYGPLGPSGEATDAAGTTVELWRSVGDATQSGPFYNKTFQADVSFQGFQDALRLIAARTLALGVSDLRDRDMAGMFGPAWSSRRAWVVADINVAQEVHTQAAEAYIGGSFTRLAISARPR